MASAASTARLAWSSWADRNPHQGHEAVAEELVDRAPVALDLGDRELEEAAQKPLHVLGAPALGERGRADDVAEEDRDGLVLALGERGGGGIGVRRLGLTRATRLDLKRRSAGAAKACPRGDPPAAGGAGRGD